MTLDVLLLVSGGLIAIIAGGAVAVLGPRRLTTLVAAGAIASVGALQFGWARAIYGLDGVGPERWFDLSLSLAHLVTVAWLFLSITLARGERPPIHSGWRAWIVLHVTFSAGVLAAMAFGSGRGFEDVGDSAPSTLALAPIGMILLGGVVVNLTLTAANLEATYLALGRKHRRALRPALIGILIAVGYFVYNSAHGLLEHLIDLQSLSHTAIPLALLSLLVSISLVQGRVADARPRKGIEARASAASVTLTTLTLAGAVGAAWLAAITGRSLGRVVWVGGALLGAAILIGLTLSSRIQRWFEDAVVPQWERRGLDRRALRARARAMVRRGSSLSDLAARLPRDAKALSGAEAVSLFLNSEDGSAYRLVGSTLEPLPPLSIGREEPLVRELRRVPHAIRLRGRIADLDYIPILVENGPQLSACHADFAVPLSHDDEFLGFMLCAARTGEEPESWRPFHILDIVSGVIAHRVASSGQGLPESPISPQTSR